MPRAKEFSCMYCGTQFQVSPPDDNHPTASLDKPNEAEVQGTIKEMSYDCKNKDCLKPTILYWYRQKMSIGRA